MDLIKKLDCLPIPEDLIRENLKIHEDHCVNKIGHAFKNHKITEELEKFIRNTLNLHGYTGLLTCSSDIRIHKDINELKYGLNFLIDVGALIPPQTVFYDDNHCEMSRFVLEKNQWYFVRTDVFHTVIGIEPNRTRKFIRVCPFRSNLVEVKHQDRWMEFLQQQNIKLT